MTSERALEIIALAATLMLAAASWVVVVRQMDGTDMGVATELGSFASFIGYWMPMMAAMMAVWTLVGLAVYAVYRPHGSFAAGALTVAAGLYELTWFKRACRRRCQESVRSGFELGLSASARASGSCRWSSCSVS
jgi:predicted metal-binding membrane protein